MANKSSIVIEKDSKVFEGVSHLVLGIFSLLCIIPLLLVISISFSNENSLLESGYSLIPKEFSLEAYGYLIASPKEIINAYMVTIFVTVVGTIISITITSMLAYGMSRKDYRWANKTSFYVFFTMLFSGGMVPWYILMSKYLHMTDNVFGLILPYIVIPWNVLLMKGFFADFPMAIIESAKIDGASEFRTFFQMVIPLNKPGIATLTLFIALMYWNDYWLSLMLINSSNMVSLQLLLYRIMSNLDFLTKAVSSGATMVNAADLPGLSARMGICIISAGPMLLIFPFFQKYFVKGLTLGAVKG